MELWLSVLLLISRLRVYLAHRFKDQPKTKVEAWYQKVSKYGFGWVIAVLYASLREHE